MGAAFHPRRCGFLRGVHPIAEHGLSADELSLTLLIMLYAFDLFGDILGVHVVHDGAEGGDIVGGGINASIYAIQQGNVAHAVFGEEPLHVVPRHNVIASQTGKVFRDYHVDLFRLDVLNHPLKRRTLEGGSTPAIIDIGIVNGQALLADKTVQQGLLVGNALRRPLALILL